MIAKKNLNVTFDFAPNNGILNGMKHKETIPNQEIDFNPDIIQKFPYLIVEIGCYGAMEAVRLGRTAFTEGIYNNARYIGIDPTPGFAHFGQNASRMKILPKKLEDPSLAPLQGIASEVWVKNLGKLVLQPNTVQSICDYLKPGGSALIWDHYTDKIENEKDRLIAAFKALGMAVSVYQHGATNNQNAQFTAHPFLQEIGRRANQAQQPNRHPSPPSLNEVPRLLIKVTKP